MALAMQRQMAREDDVLTGLIEELRDVGYGWLRTDGVRAELTQMASAMRFAGES